MQWKKTCALACLFVCAALGQTDARLKAKVASLRYPPLAEQARIQGDVHLEVDSGAVKLISGHPLLAHLAVNHAKTLGSLQGQTKFDVTYHFVFAPIVPATITVQRGNAFERAILRVFGFKAEKVVQNDGCEARPAPPSDIKAAGSTAEIWVYGRTVCAMPETATLAAKR